MSENRILNRIAAGDPDAVQECLDQFGGLVWSLARRLTSSESDAEDAVQEIFVEIWRKAERYDPSIASESTFIAMLARRRLIAIAAQQTKSHHGPGGARPGDF